MGSFLNMLSALRQNHLPTLEAVLSILTGEGKYLASLEQMHSSQQAYLTQLKSTIFFLDAHPAEQHAIAKSSAQFAAYLRNGTFLQPRGWHALGCIGEMLAEQLSVQDRCISYASAATAYCYAGQHDKSLNLLKKSERLGYPAADLVQWVEKQREKESGKPVT